MTDPVLRLYQDPLAGAHRCRGPLLGILSAAQPHQRDNGYELQLGIDGRQCSEAAADEAVMAVASGSDTLHTAHIRR